MPTCLSGEFAKSDSDDDDDSSRRRTGDEEWLTSRILATTPGALAEVLLRT